MNTVCQRMTAQICDPAWDRNLTLLILSRGVKYYTRCIILQLGWGWVWETLPLLLICQIMMEYHPCEFGWSWEIFPQIPSIWCTGLCCFLMGWSGPSLLLGSLPGCEHYLQHTEQLCSRFPRIVSFATAPQRILWSFSSVIKVSS